MKREGEQKRKESREAGGISRRDFARRAAGAAAIAAAGISAAPLSVFAGSGSSGAPAQQPPAEKLSAAGLAEAEAKTQNAFAAYGARLSDAQKSDLRRLIKEGVEPLVELRKYALANSIQPATVLRIYPEPKVKARLAAKPPKKGGNYS